MAEIVIRAADLTDVDELVHMRAEFTFEDFEPREATARPEYEQDCRDFLIDAIDGGRWQIWVGETDGQIVSHVFVALVDKVPRPIRENARIAYLTNVYTRAGFRGRGIGAALLGKAQQAAREADVELMIVWPSDESVAFYERESFERPDEPLIWRSGVGDRAADDE